ncbi:sodium:solute symporter family transporter [Prosthecobacter sp.]|uniref:sodium:solute symporter family transporter n=1 Tax=Prosthecobacter sp. TaxID=1965333 RepID=UPI003783D9E5
MTHFSWLDYTIFGGYLAASVGVGLFSARGSKSLGDYFLAGRGMNSILVAMSILAALFSGISYLAGPADVYKNGFAFAYIVLAFFIATPFTAIYMLPKFYQSRFFTAYQFLEERFSLSVRLLASGLFIFRVALWLAAATYAPALALEKVTGMPLWITILATGTLTTLYTALGGMRAVIWTDVMQLIVLFGGQMIIVFVAAGKIPGGLGGVWDTAMADGRMDLSLSFSLSERVNIWAVLVAGAFLHLVQMATDQVSVQRYLTAGSLQEAKRSLWIKLWLILPVLVLFYGTGLVLYAFYKTHGDPMAAGLIAKEDQILPYFVVTQLPAGLPGLLIAAIYAASMSTISAGLNSLASATVVDFKQRLSTAPAGTQAQQVGNARWITLTYGLIVMGLAFGVSFMPGNLVESVNTVIGLIGGPLLGLFFLGMFTQHATTRGALLGCLAGFVTLLGIFMYQNGAFTAVKPPMLVSFIWFSLLGTIITMTVGLLTSGRSAPSSDRHQ